VFFILFASIRSCVIFNISLRFPYFSSLLVWFRFHYSPFISYLLFGISRFLTAEAGVRSQGSSYGLRIERSAMTRLSLRTAAFHSQSAFYYCVIFILIRLYGAL
jgi:hypothetical protein